MIAWWNPNPQPVEPWMYTAYAAVLLIGLLYVVIWGKR